MESSEARSRGETVTSAPGEAAAMRAAARLPLSVSRTASTTDAPRAARTRAVSNPRPVFAPVITASRPCWPGTSSLVHLAVMIPPDALLHAGWLALYLGQPRARLGEPASHVRVIHAGPVGTASARSLSTGSSARSP